MTAQSGPSFLSAPERSRSVGTERVCHRLSQTAGEASQGEATKHPARRGFNSLGGREKCSLDHRSLRVGTSFRWCPHCGAVLRYV